MTAADPLVVWAAIAVLAAGTYVLRASFLVGAGAVADLPPSARAALGLVPVAVLSGLVAPAVLLADGAPAVASPRAAATVLAVAVAWRTESLLLTVGVGMGAFWGLRWLAGLG